MSIDRIDPVIVGRSKESFAAAAQDAVKQWEDQRGGPPDEPTTLKVVEMYVTVTGPLGDYIVVLGSGG
jgi:flavin-binding protein dodecin